MFAPTLPAKMEAQKFAKALLLIVDAVMATQENSAKVKKQHKVALNSYIINLLVLFKFQMLVPT